DLKLQVWSSRPVGLAYRGYHVAPGDPLTDLDLSRVAVAVIRRVTVLMVYYHEPAVVPAPARKFDHSAVRSLDRAALGCRYVYPRMLFAPSRPVPRSYPAPAGPVEFAVSHRPRPWLRSFQHYCLFGLPDDGLIQDPGFFRVSVDAYVAGLDQFRA